MRVTMGAVSTPVRRPEDAAGDAEILRRIRAGDPSAVDDLYERFRRPAFALARRILADDVLAEDVLQEVFLSVWRDPAAYERGKGSVASWLLAVVHHKAVDAVRREESQRRRQALAEEELVLDEPVAARDVEDDVWTRVVSQQVRAALGGLSAPQREALTLAYYGGYTQREVAALTGAPLGTVKTRMLSGMRRLKQELGGAAGVARGHPPRRGRPMTADHAPFDELAVGWALHALEPEDESFFVAHLAGCERCATTVAETTDVMAAMATDLPQSEPSDGLRNRIRAAVEQTEQLPARPSRRRPSRPRQPRRPAVPVVRPLASAPEPRRTVEPRSRWRRAVPLGLIAAGVAAIVGLGIWNVVLTSDRNELQATVAEQSQMVNGLLLPGQATIAPLEESGAGSVATVVARGAEVDVVTHGLPVNDAHSTTYVLWGMGGEPRSRSEPSTSTGSQMEMKTVSSG